jgi:hypothetical protein
VARLCYLHALQLGYARSHFISALANQAANGRPVKASLRKCTNSASAAEFTKNRQASDAVGEWEGLALLQNGLEGGIAVCGQMHAAFNLLL